MLVNVQNKETSHALKMPLQTEEQIWEQYHYATGILWGFLNTGVKGKQ